MRQVVFAERFSVEGSSHVRVSCLCAAADGTFFVAERHTIVHLGFLTVAVLKHLNKHGEILSKTIYDQGDREITHIAELSDARLVLGFTVKKKDGTEEYPVLIKDTDIAFNPPASEDLGVTYHSRKTVEVLVLKHQSNNDINGRVVTLTSDSCVRVWDSHNGELVLSFKAKMSDCLSNDRTERWQPAFWWHL